MRIGTFLCSILVMVDVRHLQGGAARRRAAILRPDNRRWPADPWRGVLLTFCRLQV